MDGASKVLPTQVRRRFFSAIIGADFIVAFESNVSRKAELMCRMDDRTLTVYIYVLQARDVLPVPLPGTVIQPPSKIVALPLQVGIQLSKIRVLNFFKPRLALKILTSASFGNQYLNPVTDLIVVIHIPVFIEQATTNHNERRYEVTMVANGVFIYTWNLY
jgi:hypothetical protein